MYIDFLHFQQSCIFFFFFFFFRFQVSALFRQMMKLRIKVKLHEWSLTFYTLNNSIMGKHTKKNLYVYNILFKKWFPYNV